MVHYLELNEAPNRTRVASSGGALSIPLCCAYGRRGWYSGIGGSSLVDERYRDLEKTASLQGMLGYLNFAGGKTDARFQRQLNDSYAFLAGQGEEEPWRVLQHLLRGKLETLKAS